MSGLRLLALGAALLATPVGLAAQTIKSPYRFIDTKQDVGPYIAYIFADGGSVDLGANSGPVFGLQFAIRVSDPIQISANAAYFPTTRDVQDPSTGGPSTITVGTEDFNLLLLSGRLQFNLTGARTWNRLAPYLIGGLGIAIDVTGDINCLTEPERATCQISPAERFDFGTSFMGQIGIGTAIIVSDRIGARVTFEDNIWKLSTPEGWFFSGNNLDPFPSDTDWTNNLQLTLVLSYWF
ncbi:MAG TPA: hypothetical protein VLC48_11180 [Gemmatimonadota bacterium]|nr:hypothetical protein [Gemmatimonadota bacterium]